VPLKNQGIKAVDDPLKAGRTKDDPTIDSAGADLEDDPMQVAIVKADQNFLARSKLQAILSASHGANQGMREPAMLKVNLLADHGIDLEEKAPKNHAHNPKMVHGTDREERVLARLKVNLQADHGIDLVEKAPKNRAHNPKMVHGIDRVEKEVLKKHLAALQAAHGIDREEKEVLKKHLAGLREVHGVNHVEKDLVLLKVNPPVNPQESHGANPVEILLMDKDLHKGHVLRVNLGGVRASPVDSIQMARKKVLQRDFLADHKLTHII
jgi:hypothetical protein